MGVRTLTADQVVTLAPRTGRLRAFFEQLDDELPARYLLTPIYEEKGTAMRAVAVPPRDAATSASRQAADVERDRLQCQLRQRIFSGADADFVPCLRSEPVARIMCSRKSSPFGINWCGTSARTFSKSRIELTGTFHFVALQINRGGGDRRVP